MFSCSMYDSFRFIFSASVPMVLYWLWKKKQAKSPNKNKTTTTNKKQIEKKQQTAQEVDTDKLLLVIPTDYNLYFSKIVR